MASPNPIPCGFVVTNASNMLSDFSGSIPGPESSTDTTIAPRPSHSVLTRSTRARSVIETIASIALRTKLSMTSCNWPLWPRTRGERLASFQVLVWVADYGGFFPRPEIDCFSKTRADRALFFKHRETGLLRRSEIWPHPRIRRPAARQRNSSPRLPRMRTLTQRQAHGTWNAVVPISHVADAEASSVGRERFQTVTILATWAPVS
jgi:hypothetical protein